MHPAIEDIITADVNDLKMSNSNSWDNVQISRGIERFLVCRTGAAGSSFFSKLLNSHPDVFALHEGILLQTYPGLPTTNDESLRYARWLSGESTHGAYKALGDVGSLPLGLILTAPAEYFKHSILLRHPVSVLRTKLFLLKSDASELPAIRERIKNNGTKILAALGGGADESLADDDLYFFWNAWQLATLFYAARHIDVVIKAENLRDYDYASEVAEKLTGQPYPISVLSEVLKLRINARTPENRSAGHSYEDFSRRQQNWYDNLLGSVAVSFGYNLDFGFEG